MTAKTFAAALGAALLAAPVAALASDAHTPISARGTSFKAESFGGNSRVSKGFKGKDYTSDISAALSRTLSGDEASALLDAIPIGPNSIIGPDERKLVKKTTKYPYRAVVLILFETPEGSSRCTGWMINRNTVATAGHCVYGYQNNAGWYNYKTFKMYPGYTGSSAPYGSCKAKNLYSVVGWTQNGLDDYDYGAIKLKCNVGKKTGWFGYFSTSKSLKGRKITIAGYPGDKPRTQWKSKGKVTVSQVRRVFYQNDTFGGMSGSAVYYKKPGCGQCSIAVHAYGTYNGPPFDNNNHGTRITKYVKKNLDDWKKRRK